jgi:PAS domain S-box-containing protein
MPETGLSSQVLGKLLVALQTLDVLPDEKSMAGYLQPALSEVPGIAQALMCLNGELPATDRADITKPDLQCPKRSDPSGSGRFCQLRDRPDTHLVPMRTPRRAFGCLQVVADDETQFEAYKPFLVNIGHMVATILENRGNARSLAAANSELGEVVDELEDRVKIRTAELKAAEERYLATLGTLTDAISAMRAVRGEGGEIVDFEWTYVNPLEAAQHPDTNLVGTRLLDVHPEYGELGIFDAFCGVVTTGEQSTFEVRRAHPDRGAEFAELRTSRLDDGIVVALQDVTGRHVAERSLAESKEQYRLLAENASDVIMQLSAERRYEWVSDSVADVLGWQPPDLVGHLIDEFVHPDDLAQQGQVIADTAWAGALKTEFRFRRSDGTYGWVACRSRVKVDEGGTPVAVVGGLVDIADRKAAEAKGQERLRELERFQRLTVGRELKMIELKKVIEHLKKSG